MTPEGAWNEAMKHENRANPYPFFDELRKTPVARVTNGVYAVTGYEEVQPSPSPTPPRAVPSPCPQKRWIPVHLGERPRTNEMT